jgi:hypothetical protein
MGGNPAQQWTYSALVGMSLLMAGWLWNIVGTMKEDLHRLEDRKADRSQAADRWTGEQQREYKQYVDARFAELTNEIRRYHAGENLKGKCL